MGVALEEGAELELKYSSAVSPCDVIGRMVLWVVGAHCCKQGEACW